MEKETKSYYEINGNSNNLSASAILSIIGRIIMILGGTSIYSCLEGINLFLNRRGVFLMQGMMHQGTGLCLLA
jgi:hypothetical protein